MEPNPQPAGGMPVNSSASVAGAAPHDHLATNASEHPSHVASDVRPPRTVVQPPSGLKAELQERADDNTKPTQQPRPAYVPEAFAHQPETNSAQAPLPSAVSPNETLTSTAGTVGGAPEQPSGRWQTFWYAISVFSLGFLFIATSAVTSQGTLEKMLVGLKPNPSEALFGTRLDVILGNSMLALFIVSLPLFILSTIVVDRYRSAHPDMKTVSMKKLSYVFMVLAVFLIVGQVSGAIYSVIDHTFDTVNAISIGVNIAFMLGYFGWLFTLVAEDRNS